LYWAEGAKSKPWHRKESLCLVNMDPAVIQMFLSWLDLLGVPSENRGYRIAIHESADIDAAHEYWAAVCRVPVESFARPTIKRHRPKTIRKNTGAEYHGCCITTVRQSAELYRRVEGWWRAIAVTGMRDWNASGETKLS
jgi:hypothetical protein